MSAPLSPPDLFDRIHPTRLLLWALLLVFVHHLIVGLLHSWQLPLLLNVAASASLVLIGFPLLLLKSYRARPASTLRLHPLDWGQVFWLCVVAVAVIPPAHVIGNWNLNWIPAPPELEEFWVTVVPQTATQWIGSALVIGLLVPIGEEIVFRGLVQQTARRAIGGRLAVLATGALFALAHFEPWYLLGLLLIGLALSEVYEATGTLLAPIVVHAVYNMAALTVAWWQLRVGESGAAMPGVVVAVLATVSAAIALVALGRLRPQRAWEVVEYEA